MDYSAWRFIFSVSSSLSDSCSITLLAAPWGKPLHFLGYRKKYDSNPARQQQAARSRQQAVAAKAQDCRFKSCDVARLDRAKIVIAMGRAKVLKDFWPPRQTNNGHRWEDN